MTPEMQGGGPNLVEQHFQAVAAEQLENEQQVAADAEAFAAMGQDVLAGDLEAITAPENIPEDTELLASIIVDPYSPYTRQIRELQNLGYGIHLTSEPVTYPDGTPLAGYTSVRVDRADKDAVSAILADIWQSPESTEDRNPRQRESMLQAAVNSGSIDAEQMDPASTGPQMHQEVYLPELPPAQAAEQMAQHFLTSQAIARARWDTSGQQGHRPHTPGDTALYNYLRSQGMTPTNPGEVYSAAADLVRQALLANPDIAGPAKQAGEQPTS